MNADQDAALTTPTGSRERARGVPSDDNSAFGRGCLDARQLPGDVISSDEGSCTVTAQT